MNSIEQEYSFKVTSIRPFLLYCKNNGFKKVEKTEQIRTLYKKEDKTMLRLTEKKYGRKIINIQTSYYVHFENSSLHSSHSTLNTLHSLLPFLLEREKEWRVLACFAAGRIRGNGPAYIDECTRGNENALPLL